MSKRWFAVVMLSFGLTVSTPLLADHGKGKDKDKGHPHGNPHAQRMAEEQVRHDRHDDGRWERRDDRFEYRTYADHDGRPPGWVRGEKTGWRNCGLPPGQAKKYGCYTYIHEGRRYYYYHDDVGRIVIRRPIISIRGGVDIF